MISFRTGVWAALVAGAAAFAAGCDETDAGSVTITVKPDGAGSIVASALTVPAAGPAEAGSGGVNWSSRGGVIVSRGAFTDLNGVRIGDATIKLSKDGAATVMLLSLPRGAGAKWPGVLSIGAEQRGQAADVLDPDAKDQKRTSKVGATGKFTVTLEGKRIVAHGADATVRGLTSEADKATATLIVPLEFVRRDGEAIEWRVVWE